MTTCPKSQCPHSKIDELLKTHKKCDWIPLSGARIYKGEQGSVFQVCCKEECDFMLKVQVPPSKGSQSWMDRVKREIKLQNIAAEHNLAPKIVEGWLCDHESTIIIEKARFTILQYIKYLAALGLTNAQIFTRLDQVCIEMIKKVNTLHSLGICHGDLHLKNIVVDIEGNSPQWTNLRFIDFGKATEHRLENNEPNVKKAAAYEDDDDDIKMSFLRYKKHIEDIRNGVFEDDDDREPIKQQRDQDSLFSPNSYPSTPQTPITPQKGFSVPTTPQTPEMSPPPVRKLF
jgi:serine/threonine protein kinase